MEPWFPAEGDRVRRLHDGALGMVHAVYPEDWEDNCEVLLDDGIYTCSNHRHFAPESANSQERP